MPVCACKLSPTTTTSLGVTTTITLPLTVAFTSCLPGSCHHLTCLLTYSACPMPQPCCLVFLLYHHLPTFPPSILLHTLPATCHHLSAFLPPTCSAHYPTSTYLPTYHLAHPPSSTCNILLPSLCRLPAQLFSHMCAACLPASTLSNAMMWSNRQGHFGQEQDRTRIGLEEVVGVGWWDRHFSAGRLSSLGICW